MKINKYLGIWMDHEHANIMDFNNDSTEVKSIESAFSNHEKNHAMGKGENLKHNKEQHQQLAYYKNLGEVIKGYKEVLLFGPTNAKNELFNLLLSDSHFENIKIEVKQTDKLTENQQHAYVKHHFSKQ